MPPVNITTAITGAIQKYLRKKLLKEKQYDSPLAFSEHAVEGTIPKGEGQYMEYRYRDDFPEPEDLDEGADPTELIQIVDHIVQAPIGEIGSHLDMSNLLVSTDWVDDVESVYAKFRKALKIGVHRRTQNALCITRTFTKYGISFTNTALPSIYANAKTNFGSLTPSDFITMADLIRARTRLVNSSVPAFDGEFYPCVVDKGTAQSLQEDPDFYDVVKRHESLVKKFIIPGHICDFRGIRFLMQDNPFRENLGAEGTRTANGSIVTAHMFGQECFGYLGLKGMNAKSPSFKVQDISTTGCRMTIGYRAAFSANTLKPKHGINIKGAQKYSETND
jgi:hypothetical protein